MTAKDQSKLIRAGFTIIRKDEVNLTLKAKVVGQSEWHTLYKGFKSKAAMQREVDHLLTFEKFVED